MVDFTTVRGLVRGTTVQDYANGSTAGNVAVNQRGEVLIAQAMPNLAELVRQGKSYQGKSTTGQAALTALPTTTAGFTLKNPLGSGIVAVIEAFGSWEAVVDATQTDVTAIFAMLNTTSDTAPSGGSAETTIRSLSSRVTAGMGQQCTIARGQTVVDNGWFPHATNGQMAAAAAGAQWKVNEVSAAGLYIVQPGAAFSVQAVKAAAAAASQQFFFVRWHELAIACLA